MLQTQTNFLDVETIDSLSQFGALFMSFDEPDKLYLGAKLQQNLGFTAPTCWINELIYPEDISLLLSFFDPTHTSAVKAHINLRLFLSHGELIYTQAQAIKLTEVDPPGLYLSLVYTEALKQSQQKLRRLYEQTPALLHSIDTQGCLEFVSDMWLRTFGYSREEVIGRRSTEFLTPASQALARQILPSFFELGFCEDIPYEWICKDGQLRNILLSATVERDQHGQIIRSLAILKDVTSLRQAERRAQQERLLRAQLFEIAQDAILIKDASRHIVDMNPAAERLFGWAKHELQGQSVRILHADATAFDAHHPDDYADAKARQIPYLRRDQTPFLGESVISKLSNPEHHFTGYLEVIRDITQAVNALNALEQANKQLVLSLNALEQFAYVASHDLRTPLRGIQHLSRFIQEDAPPELLAHIAPRLAQLNERTDYMDRMIQSLLTFARSDHNALQIEPVQLTSLISHISESLRFGLEQERSFSISLEADEVTQKPFSCYHISLKHILTNLINNSVLHHDGAHAQVTIRASFHEQVYHFEVEDDGPGIPQRHQARVFQIFQTLHQKKNSSSIGMGLALVQRLVNHVGGTISLMSPVHDSRGTRFCVSLPKPLENK